MNPTNVIINTRFPAFHNWPDAPQEVHYLRSIHRHEFHVTMKIRVEHENRDVEFITAKNDLDSIIGESYVNRNYSGLSCEHLCNELYADMKEGIGYHVVYVCVMEDGENGAEVFYD